ncbi:tRNA glutamyl-Q(34) synthetase GluQRS [Pseudaminobacter arsenicus]|uniref:tRNA glutamyl-Q(34) synthetase GluQRS n=1 Tax=Borborobacter arsenicus TaxID=1851146 RepID=A0A432V6E5_9HYPH|nr:tRNA glutamyl-Q(34) synthetase GluQRS [Pseudaminobacter arsenicus]RUM97744.1 tRNA glutamyl-Q(34) synthetase GluQRS [Pseudaminobacter arsenicus]
MNTPVFRFAPSPNGELHLGHAYSALLNARMVETSGGRFLLRIEDIDVTRCTPEFEAGIFRDLAWLGIEWEQPVRRQSDHFEAYESLLQRLIREELVYPAFMSRGEIRAAIAESEQQGGVWPRDPDGVPLYPAADKRLPHAERQRRIAAGEPFAWRLDTEAALSRLPAPLSWTELDDESLTTSHEVEACPQQWGDVVIARKDIPTSYHLSVVADDALQDISHVVRGRDLYQATAIQCLLQRLLGLPAPAYFHHRLILDPDGRKLSKSERDTGLATLRENGRTAVEIRRMVGL